LGSILRFRRGIWGYSPEAVLDYIERLVREAEARLAEISADVDRVRLENENLKKEFEKLSTEIEEWHWKKREISETLMRAQAEAARIEEEARASAEAKRRRIIARIATKRGELESIRRSIEEFRARIADLSSSAESVLRAEFPVGQEEVEEHLAKGGELRIEGGTGTERQ